MLPLETGSYDPVSSSTVIALASNSLFFLNLLRRETLEMPLKITHRNESEVPGASSNSPVSQELEALKGEMQKLATGMVLEIESDSDKAVRSTKMLITKAARQLGTEWRHWSSENRVYAKPVEGSSRRGRRKSSAA